MMVNCMDDRQDDAKEASCTPIKTHQIEPDDVHETQSSGSGDYVSGHNVPDHETERALETPTTTDRKLFRLQRWSQNIFGLSPVSEISSAMQHTDLNTPKAPRDESVLNKKKDKFHRITDDNNLTSSCREQLPSAEESFQILDNVGGDTKDDESSQWQQQQQQQQQIHEEAMNHSRFTLNSAGRSPASRRAEQHQRSLQIRQHSVPQRMIYDDGCKLLGSPGKETLPTEELSFYQSHSPQQSPRPCSPCMLCPDDGDLLPSENDTPNMHHVAIPIGSKNGTSSIVAARLETGGLGYRLRRPLDDHDTNSMDSGYGASVMNDVLMSSLHGSGSTTMGNSATATARTHSSFQFNRTSVSSSTISRHNSTSPFSARNRLQHSSLSSGSIESMDEMELFDMEAMEDEDITGKVHPGQLSQPQQHPQQNVQPSATMLPSGLNSLICGTIKTTRTSTTPEQKRPFVRRCLSLTDGNSGHKMNSQHGPVSVATQMKTPERYCRRMIAAVEDQENCSPYASRTTVAASSTEGVRCFKRPEPPGVSPVQSKRTKTQLDAATIVPSTMSVLDSPSRTTVLMAAVPKKVIYQKSISMNDAQIMSALSRSSSEPDLIGDFSKSYVLPLMDGQHRDLKSISGETMAGLVRGEYNDKIASFKIIDCRYPYEFEGGHIRGAKNLYTQEQIIDELIKSKAEPPTVTGAGQDGSGALRRHIIVFHCEFSSERGPKLSRFLRNHDRILNADSYPALHYPEMYLLHGGYKEFFKAHADLCDPIAYRPMLDPQFGDAYRHFRAKSRSWNGDGTGTVKPATTSTTSLPGGPTRLTKSRSRLIL